jgi:hypothetical protein
MKKIWKKPNLVVLIRSRPEESVLDHCKIGTSGFGVGAHANVTGCHDGSCDSNCGDAASWNCLATCYGHETT